MSYILDALKRADAERERGAVPGLHAQPADMPLPDDPRGATVPPWAWGLGGLGVAVLGMLAWSMWRGEPPPPDEPAAPSAQALASEPPRADGGPAGLADRGTPTPPPPSPRERTPRRDKGPLASDESGTRPPAPRHTARDTARATPDNAPAPRDKTSNEAPVSTARVAAPSPASANTTNTTNTTAGSGRLYALHELPDSVRRALPQLVIGGAMYSDNPASRMLIVNTQLFHEGDKLGPDLTIEEIKLKSAVLRFKGYRYSLSY